MFLRTASRAILRLYLLDLPNRLPALEGLRGLAVIAVFFVHFGSSHYSVSYYVAEHGFLWRLFASLHSGIWGVDLFFVLSGFLIVYLTRTAHFKILPFLDKRFLRLMPAQSAVLLIIILMDHVVASTILLVVMAVYAGVAALAAGIRTLIPAHRCLTRVTYVCYLVLLAAIVGWWLLGRFARTPFQSEQLMLNWFSLWIFVEGTPPYSYLTWSLCVEFLFYAAFVGYTAVFMRIVKKHGAWFLLALGAGVFLFGSMTVQSWGAQKRSVEIWVGCYRSVGFLFGALVAWLYADRAWWARHSVKIRRISGIALLLLPVWIQVWLAGVPNPAWWFLGIDVLCAALVAGGLVPGSLVYRLFDNVPLRLFGTISYSFYLIHAQVIALSVQIFPKYDFTTMSAQFAIAFAGSTLAASVLYYLFERPYMMKKFDGKARSHQAH